MCADWKRVVFSSRAPISSVEVTVGVEGGNRGQPVFLAPTGALQVIVVYYTTSAAARPHFEISSISANIFSFLFEN